ncbi:hypothetical protein CEXT_800691 [Caerostris extrusa]|uniref:Uncharacterized protein n=1 Tax=Caerostris extrusa TaxID=172846 RepID=A0AAV4TLZ3_CAEEX|nr:hypothetical protein CEXT_800691 [Caerostris extrusa]
MHTIGGNEMSSIIGLLMLRLRERETVDSIEEGHLPGDLPPRDDDGAPRPPASSDVVPVHHEGKLPGVLQRQDFVNMANKSTSMHLRFNNKSTIEKKKVEKGLPRRTGVGWRRSRRTLPARRPSPSSRSSGTT